jgi:uncharacterized protein involved in high-affinity Fe2+ transport
VVAFVEKDGTPVKDADVRISYRTLSGNSAPWMDLPVVRMHMAGMSLDSTHYGNNLYIPPGNYEVRVSVNGQGPATFQITLEPIRK